MPLAQIDLSSSHLPSSCSFFLSALSSLGYRCLGQRGKDIAFGIENIEFYIKQQDPSSQPSPTRIAFHAFDQRTVDEFYSAAITAGGRSKAPPGDHKDESPYYSATVLDFDDNQIEVMYRQDTSRVPSNAPRDSELQRIDNWQNTVAYRLKDGENQYKTSESPRVTVNNITTAPGVEVYRVKQDSRADGEISTKAIISTLLGASAGAAVAYAMAKSDGEKPSEVEPPRVAYRAIEAPPQRVTEVIYEHPAPSGASSHGIQMNDREAGEAKSKHSIAGSRVKTVTASEARSLREGTAQPAGGSHTGRTIAQTSTTKIIASKPEQQSRVSHSPHVKTISDASGIRPMGSSHSTALRSAKDVPLPPSKVSTNLTPATDPNSPLNDLGTVVPEDSISQVSTRRPSTDRGSSKHRRSHHSTTGHESKHTKHSSHGSNRTIKVSEKHASKASTHRR